MGEIKSNQGVIHSFSQFYIQFILNYAFFEILDYRSYIKQTKTKRTIALTKQDQDLYPILLP